MTSNLMKKDSPSAVFFHRIPFLSKLLPQDPNKAAIPPRRPSFTPTRPSPDQAEMPCDLLTHLFPGIQAALFPDDRKKPAACKFIVNFAGIDKRKPPPEVWRTASGSSQRSIVFRRNCFSASPRSKKHSTLIDCGESITAT